MVSTGTDGDGDPLGDPAGALDGWPDGDGDVEGAGVASGGPGSIDGANVGGTLGTCPRLPDDVHAAVATSRPDSAMAGTSDR